MEDIFEEPIFREISDKNGSSSSNIIKADDFKVVGKAIISVDEESIGGIKFVLKKDENEVIKEIKFICSCGQSKSIILDYSE